MPFNSPRNGELSNQHNLDLIYKRTLGLIKEHILLLRDENEILTCAKWIARLNQAPQEEKASRNNLAELLDNQLAENNLNYPFTYPKNLTRSLQSVDREIQRLINAECSTDAGQSEEASGLQDIFSNLRHLLVDAETLNLQVEEDLESIRSVALSAERAQPLEYSVLLGNELKHLLTEEIPKIIQVPEREVLVKCGDRLRQTDSNWIQDSIEGIRRAVLQKVPEVACRQSVSKAVQTPPRGRRKSTKLDELLERTLSRFYTDFMLMNHTQKIQEKAREGIGRIEQCRELTSSCLKRSSWGEINDS